MFVKSVASSASSERKPNEERFRIHKLLYLSGFMWDVWRVESLYGWGKYRITTFH